MPALDFVVARSVLDRVAFTDPRVGAFDGAHHLRVAAQYRIADAEHVSKAVERVRRAVAEHMVAARDTYPDEARLVERQANLSRRHLPIRELFRAAPHVLTAVKPCWAMSPLLVSELLPGGRAYFSVCVFDEASQVRPADAVPAIARAERLVVAGDPRQLPPTSFFDAAPVLVDAEGSSATGEVDDTDEAARLDAALTEDYESILDGCSSLLRESSLSWHYRSRDERLIGFSNAYVYDRSLVTFPGVAGVGCLTHEQVEQGSGPTGQDSSVGAEVSRVVTLVLEHARARPGQTLGVITMGLPHAQRIDAALRRALLDHPDLHHFFAQPRAEPFFVKNLERVQGDQRDAIILSVGYGRTDDGRMLYRFGPLNAKGGERRLNVAVTRAKHRMTVVSAFGADDLDPARLSAEGAKLLRAYLEYAASGGTRLGEAAPERPALNPFEISVRDQLTAAGIPLVPQYGVAGYFIDFAAGHPARPGRMVLAIEADGARYHSSRTARDRDRLRQEHLERLGWVFHRIWSTDWFNDPGSCVARARAAYDAALVRADAVDARDDLPGVGTLSSTPAAPPRPVARQGPKPKAPYGSPVTAFTHRQLVALVRWITSDTLLRTEEELVAEVMAECGFRRRGSQINAAIAAAIREVQRRP